MKLMKIAKESVVIKPTAAFRRRVLLTLLLVLSLLGTAALAQSDPPIGSTTHYLRWVSGTDSTITGNDMVSNPLSNRPTEHVMELGFSYTGETTKYGVEIRLPAYLFNYRQTDASGNPIGGTQDGAPIITINGKTQVDVPLAPYPEEPAETIYKFNYRIEGDEIVISNYGNFPSGETFTMGLRYNLPRPSYVMDGYVKDDIQASFTVKPRDGGEPVTFLSDPLTIQYNTSADVRSVSKYVNQVYTTWPFYNTPKPADYVEGEYIYASYRVRVTVDYNDSQPYYVKLTELIPAGEKGELYAWGSTYGPRFGGLADWTLAHEKAIQVRLPKYDYTQDTTGRSESTYDFYLFFRYKVADLTWMPLNDPKNPGATYTIFKNGVQADLYGIDLKDHNMVSAQTEYTYKRGLAPPVYPGIAPDIRKYDGRKSGGMITAMEEKILEPWILNSGGAVGNFRMVGGVQSYGFSTTSPTTKDYGANPYTIHFTDNTLNMTTDAGRMRLESGDYQFKTLAIDGFFHYFLTDPTNYSSWTSGDYPWDQYPATTLSYQKDINGPWIKLGDITRVNGNYQNLLLTYVDGTTLYNPKTSSNNLMKVPLPEGTVGIRLSVHADARMYRTIFNGLYLETELLDSPRVMAALKDAQNRFISNVFSATGVRANSTEEVPAGATSANHEITRSVVTSTVAKGRGTPVKEANAGGYRVHYYATQYEQITWPDPNAAAAIANSGLLEQREGTFYDLLPPGAKVDPATIVLRQATIYGWGFTIPHVLSMVDNWEGTGRTMMIVKGLVPQDKVNYYTLASGMGGTNVYSGMRLDYDMTNTWANVAAYGSTLKNYVAYEAGSGVLKTASMMTPPACWTRAKSPLSLTNCCRPFSI